MRKPIVISLVLLGALTGLGLFLLHGEQKAGNASRASGPSAGGARIPTAKYADAKGGWSILALLRAIGSSTQVEKQIDRPAIFPYVSHVATLVGPHAAPRLPPNEDGERLRVWNIPVTGLGVVTLSEPKDNPRAWSFVIQQEISPENLAPPGGMTRLCQHEDNVVYEIDQGPLAGSFVEQRGKTMLVVANQEFIVSQHVASSDCLVSAGRAEGKQ